MFNPLKFEILKRSLEKIAREPYTSHSRIHPLRSFSNSGAKCFVKRDDELSFSISGSKIRKYLSLIPHIKMQGVDQVVLVGGAFSNNVLGLTQLAIENGLKPILFLREAGSDQLQGNRLLIEMLVEKSQIHWISRRNWENVNAIAGDFIRELEKLGVKSFFVPEGACIEASLPGALTLPLDIVENEIENKIDFDHIFIEAGTGLQSIALILGMNRIGHHARIHVIMLAEDAKAFTSKLTLFSDYFNDISMPENFSLYPSKIAASFGSVNRELIDKIITFARAEGVFLDPVYSAKLFITGHRLIEEQKLMGNILFIHSGGGLSLSGFQDRLALSLKTLTVL